MKYNGKICSSDVFLDKIKSLKVVHIRMYKNSILLRLVNIEISN